LPASPPRCSRRSVRDARKQRRRRRVPRPSWSSRDRRGWPQRRHRSSQRAGQRRGASRSGASSWRTSRSSGHGRLPGPVRRPGRGAKRWRRQSSRRATWRCQRFEHWLPRFRRGLSRFGRRRFQPRRRSLLCVCGRQGCRFRLPLGALLPQPPGTLLQAVGRKCSGPHRSGMVVAALRRVDGTGQGLDVTVQPLRGETGPGAAEKPKRRTSPTSDLFRARSAAQPLPAATSGRGRPERRGRTRAVLRRENSAAGAREFHGPLALRARPRPAGRPPTAATSGRRRLGEARAPLASHSAAAVRCPKLLVGVALQRSDVRSAATKSKVARRSGNCLPRRGERCTRSG
jgi:hypothetical protein